MRTICFFFFSIFCLSSSAIADDFKEITRAEQITYEWLSTQGAHSGYTDHVSHFKEVFNNYPVKTMLEFGLGFSSKYFLDSCNKLISVEFITEGYSPEWMNFISRLFGNDYPNWVQFAYFSTYRGNTDWASHKYFASEHLQKANVYQNTTKKNYALIDDFYLKELNAFIENLTQSHEIDLAFVDPGIYLRGDLVTLLFHRVPVIIAHDTSQSTIDATDDVYGYTRIVTPTDYEEIRIPSGKGTTVWIKKEESLRELTQKLKEYASNIH